jgi:hypothetical protein
MVEHMPAALSPIGVPDGNGPLTDPVRPFAGVEAVE